MDSLKQDKGLGTTVIGLSGLARSGKDTLCELLIEEFKSQGIRAKRFALADELKKDLQDLCMRKFGIDPMCCSSEEKSIIRPLLVAYGFAHRKMSEGKYWTAKLQRKIFESMTLGHCDIAIITDIRYAEYEEDETFWLANRMCGILIHVSRLREDGTLILPPNSDEERNDPFIEKAAHFKIKWPTTDREGQLPFVKELIKNAYD